MDFTCGRAEALERHHQQFESALKSDEEKKDEEKKDEEKKDEKKEEPKK